MVGKFWPVVDDEEIHAIVKASLEGGINWFDTAEVYGWGQSEQALSRALKALDLQPGEVTIASKWWPVLRSSSSIPKTIGDRLRCLGGFPIDLYQIHQPYSLSSIRSQMTEMAGLVNNGYIRFAGVSNFSAKQMREAHRVLAELGLPLVSNQVKYSLLDRRIERNGILETAQELGIAIIAYSPLEQGLLTGKFHKDPGLIKRSKGPRRFQSKFQESGLKKSQPVIDLLGELAVKYNVSSSQIALNWLIHAHGDTVLAIPGASKVSHAKENTGAMTFRLTSDEIQGISEAARAY